MVIQFAIGHHAEYYSGMSHYWADWDSSYSPHVLRRDTRLYWEPQISGTVGRCVGTFVGENPGGGMSINGLGHSGYSPLQHQRTYGDRTLRLLLSIWQLAVFSYGLPNPRIDDYIEILNTYYFRNPQQSAAASFWSAAGGASIYYPAPSASSRFVLLGWGVGCNTSSEAAATIPLLRGCTYVIVPDSHGTVFTTHGSALRHPVHPAPVAPSYILKKSKILKPLYTDAVARALK